jgi:hypothetical protein
MSPVAAPVAAPTPIRRRVPLTVLAKSHALPGAVRERVLPGEKKAQVEVAAFQSSV